MAPAMVRAEDDIASKIINNPNPESFNIYGLKDKKQVVRDKNVQWGKALKVPVLSKGQNPWDIGMSSGVSRAIKAGDKIVTMAYLRVENAEDGAGLVNISLGLAQAPYTALVSKTVALSAEWKPHIMETVADKDYDKDTLNYGIQFAHMKQTVFVGPVFVIDMDLPPEQPVLKSKTVVTRSN